MYGDRSFGRLDFLPSALFNFSKGSTSTGKNEQVPQGYSIRYQLIEFFNFRPRIYNREACQAGLSV